MRLPCWAAICSATPTRPCAACSPRSSIFKRLAELGQSFAFVNGYPLIYLQAVHLPYRGQTEPFGAPTERWARRLGPAAAPFAFAAAGGELATFDEVRSGQALCHDLTNRAARDRGSDLPLRTPEEAAEVVARRSSQADFTMFDYFLTDEAGHLQDFALAERALADLDAFLRSLLERLPLAKTSLFVTSDHGNIEDLRRRNHTLAKVPLLLFGPASTWTDPPASPDRLDQVAALMSRASRS